MGLLDEAKTLDTNTDVIDIALPAMQKKRFRIDGDNNRILELNTSDLGILGRLESATPRLVELKSKALGNVDADSLSDTEKLTKSLQIVDDEIRAVLDEVFDAPVSKMCAPFGTMCDPINGEFRFEIIIKQLSKLYEDNIKKELDLMSRKISKHTKKYTK